MDDPSRPAFELDGESVALDFANTWEDRSTSASDKLGGYADLVTFAAAAGIVDPPQAEALAARGRDRPAAAAKAMAAAVALREALYRIFSGLAAGSGPEAPDLERLSTTVARAAKRLGLEPEGGAFAWRWRGLESSLEAPLAAIAWSAAKLLTGGDLGRLRECDGTRCNWLFLDRSRNRSRRWCSMESCGNRAKARRHYRRTRATGRRTEG